MSDLLYILKDGKPVPCGDIEEWGKWYRDVEARRVDYNILPGDIKVSTVFLGIDHRLPLGEKKDPVLFETMIFGGEHDQYQARYATLTEAKAGHIEAVNLASGRKR